MRQDTRHPPLEDADSVAASSMAADAGTDAGAATLPANGSDMRFLLRGPDGVREGTGCLRRLASGTTATLASRVDGFFAGTWPDEASPEVLVGALPFDPAQHDHLYQPFRFRVADAPGREDTAAWTARAEGAATLDPDGLHARQEPTVSGYAHAVAECVARLRGVDAATPAGVGASAPQTAAAGRLRKVVLARSLHVEAAHPIDPVVLADRLGGDPTVTTFIAALPVARGEHPAWLVGATPELLVSRRGRAVLSHPLAGSARRLADAQADRTSAQALLASDKDQHEHRFVVEAIHDALSPLCARLQVPSRPSLHATATMWHLGTRICGELKDPDVSSAALAAILHPTPAVCGTPSLPALRAIRELEPDGRGFYAGAVGWTDAAGDGDWYVSIRCARVQGQAMRLFAGAGIVAGSVPALEVEETAVKFMAMLNAMGISDHSVL